MPEDADARRPEEPGCLLRALAMILLIAMVGGAGWYAYVAHPSRLTIGATVAAVVWGVSLIILNQTIVEDAVVVIGTTVFCLFPAIGFWRLVEIRWSLAIVVLGFALGAVMNQSVQAIRGRRW